MHNIFFRADFLMLCSIIELYNADLNRYFWIEVKILESTNHSNSDNSVEKAMATHSSTLVWKIPWMVEPGRLRPMGSLRVRHDWASSLSLFAFMYWRRKWHPTPVFLPGESQDGGAWWAAVYGVAQSRTRLKRLSSSRKNGNVWFVENQNRGCWK